MGALKMEIKRAPVLLKLIKEYPAGVALLIGNIKLMATLFKTE